MGTNDRERKVAKGDRPLGYNPMNEGYIPDGQKGYSPKAPSSSKVPTPPKGGTAATKPTGAKK